MLLNPNHLQRKYPDRRSGEIMAATVDFFESRGKARLKQDDHDRVWYSDFLDHIGRERIFASLLTPSEYGSSGADACRWDTYRISEFAEIVGFYGLSYWYPFQVTALGLGPIWMSDNSDAKRKAAAQLEAGEVFAFGLSEQTHGADVYQTDMNLTPSEHGWTASGEKYYIGNANVARMVSTFGKIAGTDEYVFFAADSQHDRYELIKNVVNSQNFVANYALRDYPVTEADLLHRGPGAFHAALNTVNVCKYNLGWGAVGMCTHAMYEAVTHASNRILYGTVVTDFSHVRRLLTDAYARLVAMRLVCARACDYMRSASADDRRYLLYSPLTKGKVTGEGEKVVTALWDVIAAKGVEKDTFFEAVTREIGLLPRLEGTVHINIGLLGKFMPNFLFAPDAALPLLGRRDDAADDAFLFARARPAASARCASTTGARCSPPTATCPTSRCCASRSTCSPTCWPAPPRTRPSRRTSTSPSPWASCSRRCPTPSSSWRRPRSRGWTTRCSTRSSPCWSATSTATPSNSATSRPPRTSRPGSRCG